MLRPGDLNEGLSRRFVRRSYATESVVTIAAMAMSKVERASTETRATSGHLRRGIRATVTIEVCR
jgi:hypothetical protein